MADQDTEVTKDDLDKFYEEKKIKIADELLLLRKEYRDIDADQRQIFDNENDVGKDKFSPKNEDEDRERNNSFFQRVTNRVSIKKLAKQTLAMPSQLIDTSKDLKNKLYDHRQNRHQCQTVKQELRNKVDHMIREEQTKRNAPYRDVIPCLNCRNLWCGRRENLRKSEKSKPSQSGQDQTTESQKNLDKKGRSSCCCNKKEESDSDSNEDEESEEVFDDLEPQPIDGIIDFNGRLNHFRGMVEDLPEIYYEEQWAENATPLQLQTRSLLMLQKEAKEILEQNESVGLSYHELVTKLVPVQNAIGDLRAKLTIQKKEKESEEVLDKDKGKDGLGKDKDKNPEANTNEGFKQYGTSIENFFNLEWWLIKAFFCLTVLCIPQIAIFADNWQLTTHQDISFLSKISFGGLGEAANVCSEGFVEQNPTDDSLFVNLYISCSQNYIVTDVLTVGNTTTYEIRNDLDNRICSYDADNLNSTQSAVYESFYNQTVSQCQNQTGSCNAYIDVTDLVDSSQVAKSIFWIQAACTLQGGDEGEPMQQKRLVVLAVATIGLIMCIYFRFTITRIYNDLKYEEKILDLELVSVEDYTITGIIPGDLYELILRQTEIHAQAQDELQAQLAEDPSLSTSYTKPIKRFEKYLKEVIQANLERYERKNGSNFNKQKSKFDKKEKHRIVDISYAFKNRIMLKYLLRLNKELAKLGSVVPGCCWRLKYRKGLKQKVAEEDSDDEDDDPNIISDEKTNNQMIEEKVRPCSKTWCRAKFCGQRDAINQKVERFLEKHNIADDTILDKPKLKDVLEKFFKEHNISIKLDDVYFDYMMKKIDTNDDGQVDKTELKNYIKLAIHSYKSDFAAMDDIEDKMFKLKEENFVDLTKPKNFWVTFMETEAANNMLKLKSLNFKRHPQPNLRIKRKIDIQRAKNPSDILWINVGIKNARSIGMFILMGLVVLVMLFGAQILFAAEISTQMYIGYRASPPGVNCAQISGYLDYQGDDTDLIQQEFQILASIEYLRIQQAKSKDSGLKSLNERLSRFGALPCFCEQQKDAGVDANHSYDLTKYGVTDETEAPICKGQMKYSNLFGEAQIVYYGLSTAVVIQSFFFRYLFMKLATTLKMSSESHYLSLVIASITLIFFINYGIAYLFGPIKLGIPYFSGIQDFSIYYDLNQAWFGDIGELIVVNALLYAVMPFLEDIFLVWLLLSYFLRLKDKADPSKKCCCIWLSQCFKCCCKKSKGQESDQDVQTKTRTTSLFDYKNLKSGPDFDIHYKYSYMLTLTWVTFLFAPGMPILFPIALVAMLILYTSNQFMLAYVCRRPPAYDETMTKMTLKLLKVGPLFYAMMGAWLYSNQQVFYNNVYANEGTLMMPTHHKLSNFFTQVTPGTVFLVYLFVAPVFIILKWVLSQCSHLCCPEKRKTYCFTCCENISNGKVKARDNCCKIAIYKCGERLSQTDDESLEQDLPSFYKALTLHDRLSLIYDEIENYKRLQIKRLSLENFLYLIFMPHEKEKKRLLQGKCSYRILRQSFAEKFNYISNPGFGLRQTDFVVSPYGNERDDNDAGGNDVDLEQKDNGDNKYFLEMKKCQLDVVRAAADLAYISPELGLRLHFSPGYIHLNNKAKSSSKTLPDKEASNDRIDLKSKYKDVRTDIQ